MKNKKIKILISVICLIIALLASCTANDSNNIINSDETESDTPIEISSADITVTTESAAVDPKYAHIRFGAAKDILLFDVEWHTAESFKEAMTKVYGEELPDWVNDNMEKIKNNELYMSKTVNGKNTFAITSSNPYNNLLNWDPKDVSQINPDGYYIWNIYPFQYNVYYTDGNNEYHFKNFPDDLHPFIYSEKEFNFYKNDIISYCDGLLAEGKITQEQYDFFAIKSPLDYYVRILGLFGEEDMADIQPADIPLTPAPKLITDKTDFSILYVGNSFTYTGDVPKQVSTLSSIYGITVAYDSICPGGATLHDTMEQAVKKIQDNKYDYVVFQDYGGRQANDMTAFMSDAEILCDEARKSGAIPVSITLHGYRQTTQNLTKNRSRI